MSVTDRRKEFLQSVDKDLEKVEGHVRAYRRWNTLLLIGAAVAGAIAALLAGGMAASQTSQKVVSLAGGWQRGCALAALAAAAAPMFSGVHSVMRVGDRLGNALACAGQLVALRFSLSREGTDLTACEERYRAILEKCGEYRI